MNKLFGKIISMVLAASFIATSLGQSAFAASGATPAAIESPSVVNNQRPNKALTFIEDDTPALTTSGEKNENANIKGTEKIDKRGTYSKNYQLENGTNEVVLFALPVHYKEDGKYKEIDNSLELVTDASGKKSYKNKANSFDVNISADNSSEWDVTLKKGPYTIQWKINDIVSKNLGESKEVLTRDQWEQLTESDKRHTVPNLSSEVNFSSILDNIDLQYIVQSNRVKENFIINAPSNLEKITQTIEVEGLSLSLNKDHTIDANDTR